MNVSMAKRRILLLILFLPLTLLFLSLGRWQWHRAIEKQTLLDRADYNKVYPITLSQLQLADKEWEYRRIRLRGQYIPTQSFFLINQFLQHHLGRHVITPFLTESGGLILVDRGWVANADPRYLLSDAETIFISGRLRLLHEPHFVASASPKLGAGPLELTQLDRAWLEQHWGQRLLPYSLLLDGDEPEGYERDWVVTAMTPQKHRAYAVQWFALAAVSIIMLIIFLKRVNKS